MAEFSRNDLIKHVNAIRGAMNIKGPASKKFAMTIYKNSKIIDLVMAQIQKRGTPEKDQVIDAYEAARDEVAKSFAKLDAAGLPILNPQTRQYQVDPEKAKEHEEGQKALLLEHKDAVDKIQKFNEDFDAYMKDKVEVPYSKIMEGDIPNDNISANDILNLDFMIAIPPENPSKNLSVKN